MPWSSDDTQKVKPRFRRYRGLGVLLGTIIFAFFAYMGAVWFVSFDCETQDNQKALTYCSAALQKGWIDQATRVRLLKRLSEAQVTTEKYSDALVTLAEVEKRVPFGFNEYQNRYVALYFMDKKEDALKDIEAALALRPENEDVIFDYVNTSSDLGNLDNARRKLLSFLTKNPKHFRALMHLSRIEYDARNAVQAREYAKRATEAEEMNAEAHNMLGLAYELEGNHPDALDHYSRANLYDKQNPVYLTNRAMLHYDKENYAAAKWDYEASLKLSRNFDNLYGLALTILEQDDEAPAKALLDEALTMRPDDLLVMIALGRYHYYEDELEAARKVLAKAKTLSPEDTRSDYWMASIDYAEGKYEAAISGYQASLKDWPQSAAVYTDLGNALLDGKREIEALAALNRALELNPSYANAWDGRARVWVWQSKWDEAYSDASKAIELNDKRGVAYARRAYAAWWKGDIARARSDYDAAIKLSPNTNWIAIERADFIIATGADNEKDAIMEDVHRRKTDPVEILRLEGRLAEARNKMSDAIAVYRKAAALAPTNVWRQEDVAWAMIYNDQAVDALGECEKMLRIAPKEAASHRCRARAYRIMNNNEKAVLAANDALVVDPTYDVMSLDKAFDLIVLLRHQEALDVLTPLVRRKFRPELTHFYRGLAQVELKQPELAIKDFEKALGTARGQLAKDINMELTRVRSKSGFQRRLNTSDYPQLRSQSRP